MRNVFEQHAKDAFEPSSLHADPEAVYFSAAQGQHTAAYENYEEEQNQGLSPANSMLCSGPRDNAEQSEASDVDEGSLGEEGHHRRRRRDMVDYERMPSEWAASGWLRQNPLGVPTEREWYVEVKRLPVFRMMLVKKGRS
jgi:hypothetical protein